jgi:hypothetical protein
MTSRYLNDTTINNWLVTAQTITTSPAGNRVLNIRSGTGLGNGIYFRTSDSSATDIIMDEYGVMTFTNLPVCAPQAIYNTQLVNKLYVDTRTPFIIPSAPNKSDYLYWSGSAWVVGNANITLGGFAGNSGQGANAVALGYQAGQTSQGQNGIAIGFQAGNISQSNYGVAIGYYAGQTTQGDSSVAVGVYAGILNQGTNAVAIGSTAAYSGQGNYSVAIGDSSGEISQGINAVAIGRDAGYNTQGANSIAIGNSAGFSSQPARSIIINASGSSLNASTTDACFIKPIRNASTASNTLFYDSSTNEVVYQQTANVFNNIVYFGTTTVTIPNKLYYLATAGGWVLANYTNSIGKLLAIAVGTSSSVNGMYISSNTGSLVISVPSANIGDALFVTSVAGEIGIQPSGSNTAIVRQIGYKISATEIKFYLYPIYITAMGSNGYGIATQIGGTSATITDTNSYQLLSWTNTASVTRTFTVTVAGLFDMLLVGGGGGGGGVSGGSNGEGGGGGGAGQVSDESIYLPLGTYDVVVGAGGTEGAAVFGGASGINIQPVASAGRLRFESLGGVAGGGPWGGGQKGYNSGGASYRSGYGGSPSVASFALFGTAGGASNGSGNNGGGGGALTAGSTRTTTTPSTAILGGGGTGLTTTFTGVSTTYGVGGCAGGSSGSIPAAPAANTGSGGAGGISTGVGQSGASGFVAIRYRL